MHSVYLLRSIYSLQSLAVVIESLDLDWQPIVLFAPLSMLLSMIIVWQTWCMPPLLSLNVVEIKKYFIIGAEEIVSCSLPDSSIPERDMPARQCIKTLPSRKRAACIKSLQTEKYCDKFWSGVSDAIMHK